MKKLYRGDNLDVLKILCRENDNKPFIDLIYIDPPLRSYKSNYDIKCYDYKNFTNQEKIKDRDLNSNYINDLETIHYKDELEELRKLKNLKIYNFLKANNEILTDNQLSYLIMMSHRIYYMHKLLKDIGSFYLHCDPSMSHYLRIIMDIIFGESNFRNEIIWHHRKFTAFPGKFQTLHDVILFYGKSNIVKFNNTYRPYSKCKEEEYKFFDKENNKYWRWHYVNGKRYKVYLEDHKKGKGIKLGDVWQINPVDFDLKSEERLGYPTQKPESLLERIIKVSSVEGDIVADFFCGSGTTISVAEKLKRNWIGVDLNPSAIELIKNKRLSFLESTYKIVNF